MGRKSKDIYGNWEESSINLAVQAVQEEKMEYHKAAIEFKVLKTSLRKHVNSKNKMAKNILADTQIFRKLSNEN